MSQTTGKYVVVVCGPTASGKTGAAIELAVSYGTSVISADSRQVHERMPVGTAQPTEEQLERVRHYLIATCAVTGDYNAGRFETDAIEALEEIFSEKDIAIVAGGSGMYIDALCNGLDNIPEKDDKLRQELSDEYSREGLEVLLEKLRLLDPEYYERVDRDNPARVIRAIEACTVSGKKYSELRTGEKKPRNFDVVKIGLTLPRPNLYERINRRVDEMVEAGLVEEARKLYPYRNLNALQTVGYKELFGYFDGSYTLGEAVELIKRNTRRYAKRQMTWFNRDKEIEWFSPEDIQGIMAYINKRISK